MTGRLYVWHENGYGMIGVTVKEKYFLHISNIAEIPDGLEYPPIGSRVYFDVAPAVNGGKFLQAVNAKVVPPEPPKACPVLSGNGGAR